MMAKLVFHWPYYAQQQSKNSNRKVNDPKEDFFNKTNVFATDKKGCNFPNDWIISYSCLFSWYWRKPTDHYYTAAAIWKG